MCEAQLQTTVGHPLLGSHAYCGQGDIGTAMTRECDDRANPPQAHAHPGKLEAEPDKYQLSMTVGEGDAADPNFERLSTLFIDKYWCNMDFVDR